MPPGHTQRSRHVAPYVRLVRDRSPPSPADLGGGAAPGGTSAAERRGAQGSLVGFGLACRRRVARTARGAARGRNRVPNGPTTTALLVGIVFGGVGSQAQPF